MTRWNLRQYALSSLAAVVMLAGCGGGSQLPVGISHVERSAATVDPVARQKDHGYKVLYDFQDVPDGLGPTGLTMVNGTFYGTTGAGGSCYDIGCGTVFEITPSGSERVIYRFKGGTDGDGPVGNLVNLNGTLYGVTNAGGGRSGPCAPPNSGCGTVFKVSTAGDEHVLYRFKGGKDGNYPLAGLTSLDGMLYGTTDRGGGYYGLGTIFEIAPTGGEKVLYRFKGGASDGWGPQAPLVVFHEKLYGTTAYGGCNLCDGGRGTVFSVNTSGVEQMLYAFQGAAYGGDGALPEAGLIAIKDVLYGTTVSGGYDRTPECGSSSGHGLGGCGVVFSVTLGGKERILHRFKGAPDGAAPAATLVAENGQLFGTTITGGIGSGNYLGHGTVFEVTLQGSERVLHRFGGAPDGNVPIASLVYYGKKLYGTTASGGDGCQRSGSGSPPGCGTVFELSP